MKLGHIAIWTQNLEEMRAFYVSYFNGKSNQKYENKLREFESYFISFDGDTSMELMKQSDVTEQAKSEHIGLNHFAFRAGSKKEVIQLTERLRTDGYNVFSNPRLTGDGYFESIIADPDNNRVEITFR